MLRLRPIFCAACMCITLSACQTHQTKTTSENAVDTAPASDIANTIVESDELTSPASANAWDCSIEEFGALDYQLSDNTDLWARIRKGYAFGEIDHARVQTYLEWYQKHPTYIERVGERGSLYLYYIVERLEEEGLPTELALLPIVESAFDPFAYSHGRAAGIWQFIPGTGKRYGLEQNWWYDGRRDIVESTEAAISYLKYLNNFFDDNWLHALAAYNSGEGTVKRAKQRNEKLGKSIDYWSLRLPKETAAYVPQLIALSKIIADPEKYGLELPPIVNAPYFEIVEVGSQIDLAQAAELADISINELYRINPGYNRWATDPKGHHSLLIPTEKIDLFNQNLADLPQDQRVGWERYTIANGDSLIRIANKFNTDVATLKATNNLKNNTIRAGDALIIPVAKSPANQYTQSQSQRISRKQNTSPTTNTQKIIYTTKQGDSFWSIAKKYRVGIRELAKWNGLAPTDPLQINQKLTIWTRTTTVSSTPSAPQTTLADNATVRKVSYKVRKGDSLARIAQKFNLSVQQIKNWNSSYATKKYLQPGDLLTLFVNVTNLH